MKIEIQNLCKTIKKVPILQDITVTFESGKISENPADANHFRLSSNPFTFGFIFVHDVGP